jgi:AcrR family transcriptional regulator
MNPTTNPIVTTSPAARATIQRILTTALEVFADKGFAGARMDEIAKSAGVNKATIYYHVGNKAALYSAVLHQTLGQQADPFADAIAQCPTPEEKLRQYVRCIFENIQRHPALPRIFMREAASLGAHIPPQAVMDLTGIIGLLTGILAEGREAGVFTEATPVLVHFMIVGALGYYAQMEGVLRHRASQPAFNHPPIKAFNKILGEVENLVVGAVRLQPSTPSAPEMAEGEGA